MRHDPSPRVPHPTQRMLQIQPDFPSAASWSQRIRDTRNHSMATREAASSSQPHKELGLQSQSKQRSWLIVSTFKPPPRMYPQKIRPFHVFHFSGTSNEDNYQEQDPPGPTGVGPLRHLRADTLRKRGPATQQRESRSGDRARRLPRSRQRRRRLLRRQQLVEELPEPQQLGTALRQFATRPRHSCELPQPGVLRSDD